MIGPIDLAIVTGAVVLSFYFSIDAKTAFAAHAGFALLYVAGRFVAWPDAIGLFALGGIFQSAGHAYEGKRPAFLINAVHLLVGPLWICAPLVRAA